LNIHSLEIKKRNNSECKFDYRQSIFKNGEGTGEIILSAKFGLKSGNQEEIRQNTQKRLDYRIEKHPLDHPNIGSTFKNIPVEKVPEDILQEFDHSIKQDPFPVLPVAKLIASTDLVGKQIGGAQISTKHPNFIVNLGGAKAVDVLGLIDLVKKEIKEKFRVELEEEIMIA
jgi:UDP-N-acetylmuramate dehydrogenase